MASVRFSSVKRLRSSIKGFSNFELVQQYHHNVPMNFSIIARLPSDSPSHLYSKGELQPSRILANNQFSNLASDSLVSNTKVIASFYAKFSSFGCRSTLPLASSMTHMLNCRTYSSSVGGKGSSDGGTEVPAGSGASDVNAGGNSIIPGDWAEKIRDAWKSVVETATHAGEKVQEASDELTPYAQQLLDSHPYLNTVVIPVGGTLTATLIAWVVMPKILRKFHKYAMQGPLSVLPDSISGEPVPYEKSFWGALEDPVRYLATFIAFSQMLVAY